MSSPENIQAEEEKRPPLAIAKPLTLAELLLKKQKKLEYAKLSNHIYYHANKEIVKKKNLERYYRNKSYKLVPKADTIPKPV